MKHYEVLWYEKNEEVHTKDFQTKKQALAFYEKHKNDVEKYNWWVTKRDNDWYVVEDIVI